MEVKKIETYRMNGMDFKNLKQVQMFVENQIGKIIDSSSLRLSPSDRLSVFESIMKHKNHLREMLHVMVELDDHDENILDMDL